MIAHEHKNLCQAAEKHFYSLITGDGAVPQCFSDHVADCPTCRDRLQTLKNAVSVCAEGGKSPQDDRLAVSIENLKLQLSLLGKDVTCRTVRPFLPLFWPGLSPRIPTPITAHLEACARCRKDLRAIQHLSLNAEQSLQLSKFLADPARQNLTGGSQLRRAIAAIKAMSDRPDAVTTILEPVAPNANPEVKRRMYHGFPLAFRTERHDTALRSLFVGRTLAKVAAAAAVLLVAAALWILAPSAHATDLTDLYEAVAAAKNVHIASFLPGRNEPFHEHWISQRLGYLILSSQQYRTVYDLNQRTRRTTYADSGKVETSKLTASQLDSAKYSMSAANIIMPFPLLKEIPHDAVWAQAPPGQLLDDDTAAYELSWFETDSTGTPIRKMRRFHIKQGTKLPGRVDTLGQNPGEDALELETVMVVTYPEDTEFLAALSAP